MPKTCSASSTHTSYSCDNAIDDDPNTDWATLGEGIGAWIQLNFEHTFKITSIRIKHRATGEDPSSELFKGMSIEFSDGNHVEFTLNDNHHQSENGLTWNDIELPSNPVSNYLKITVTSVYSSSNNGFSDIEIFGCVTGILF